MLVVLLALVSVVPLGCAAPTPAPAATQAPAPTAVPAATQAPDATAVPAPTAAPATPAPSAAAEFYKGKTVTLYTSSQAGSATDLWARTIAKYLPEYTGATFVVQNETAGGGKMLYNQMAGGQIKPDGLSVAYTAAGLCWPGFVSGDPAAEYDIAKFVYLGGAESGNYFLTTAPDGKIKTVEDLKATKGLKFAHSARVSTVTLANALTIDLLGLDGKIIMGFQGATGRALAVQQGDADATVMAADTAILNRTKGTATLVIGIGAERMKAAEDVPVLMELVNVANLTDTQKKLVESIDILSDAKLLFAPPGTPQDKADFLADAFKQAYEKSGLVADLEKTVGGTIGAYIPGAELAERASNLAARKGDWQHWDDVLTKYVVE
ncbi:MAG TPA: tripartite tricarboxylate transporter substrate-binding protein [Anaerolineae bacterium]|nr:tripartite tricarboxylate transporter substrate-binding protein [Anaerolineae bacterium]HOQ98021.1 tripartite tricarboxylate transporter substrate-binding protein [Anaerolineae bacterium]HPL29844.1 tripartite tricarboxylate transporter substrate-binding protein [Anaerolineae bacterium]